jgi:hypothetical protein
MQPVMHALVRPAAMQQVAAAALKDMRQARATASSSSSSSSSSSGGGGGGHLLRSLMLFNDICLSLHSLFNGTHHPQPFKSLRKRHLLPAQ